MTRQETDYTLVSYFDEKILPGSVEWLRSFSETVLDDMFTAFQREPERTDHYRVNIVHSRRIERLADAAGVRLDEDQVYEFHDTLFVVVDENQRLVPVKY